MNIVEKIARLAQTPPVFAHKNTLQVAQELHACIGCSECLLACPAIGSPLTIDRLNRETLSGPISPDVARFARACYQCGACIKPCPVGLHRDLMMMRLKHRLLDSD
jgi:Na+-translocating ferredoxin:NAD+ oxidoreductase RnfC subunit